jgi:cysteine desulfurase
MPNHPPDSAPPVYLDYNATTPLDERVLAAMLPYFRQQFGNASSRAHPYGWDAQEAVEEARDQLATLIHAKPRELIFTSGATEAINLVLKGIADSSQKVGHHIITNVIEHSAVLDTCHYLKSRGCSITYLPVNPQGCLDIDQLEEAIKPNTILIAVMYANNEIGNLNPIEHIGAIARRHKILFFTDATQAIGKIPVDVNRDNIDLAAFSSHKLYGPKGVGALFIRQRQPKIELTPQMHGGGHEQGLRSGTLNVSGIVGFGEACRLCREGMVQEKARGRKLRDKLEREIVARIPAVFVNGDKANRLPHVTNVSFPGLESKALLAALSQHIAASSGSACSSATEGSSHVIKALGFGQERTYSAARFSLGRFTTEAEIGFAVETLVETVKHLRRAR